MQSGGSGAGGKAAGGRTSRPGGGIGGTPAARRTPYGRPQSGIEAGGTSRASGLATPGLPPAGHRDLDDEYKGGQPTPGNFAAPEPAGTPSTISRFLTPIKAAGGYFFGSVGSLLGAGSSPGVLSNSPGTGDAAQVPDADTEVNQSTVADVVSCGGDEMETASPALPVSSPSMKDMARTDSAPGQGSVLAGLRHKSRMSPAGQLPKSAELQPHSQEPTPYSSILELLREGPSHRGQERKSPHEESRWGEAAPGVWASGPARHHQTPRPPSTRPGLHDRQQMPRSGLFTMGVTPDPKSSIPRHRATTRSALAKRTPVSVTPMMQYSSAAPSHLSASKAQKTGSKPAVGWTPMRASTMAISEQYEKKDSASSKRQRMASVSPSAAAGGAAGGGTPLVGSGISSLRSYAIQPQIYRRRVRSRKEPSPALSLASAAEAAETLGNGDQGTAENHDSKLTTATARRILMTLDTLASKPAPAPPLPASKAPALPAPTSDSKPALLPPTPGVVPTPAPQLRPEASSKKPAASPFTEAPKPAPAAGGWGDALLKANASSAANAAKAIEDEIEKSKGGSAAPASSAAMFSFGVKPPASEAPAEPKTAAPLFGISKPASGASSPAPAGLFGSSPAASSPFGSSAKPASAQPQEDPKPSSFKAPAPTFSFGGDKTPKPSFGSGDETPKPAKRVQFSFGGAAEDTAQASPETAEKQSPAASLSNSKPFGGQSPLFSFGGGRASAEDVAVKSITCGRAPAGIAPEFAFGSTKPAAAVSSPFTPAPKQPSQSEKDAAAATLAEAASTPLPDDDDEEEPDPSPSSEKPKAAAPAASSGGWGAAFLASNSQAAAAATEAVQKEIEEKNAPPAKSPAAGLFSFGAPASTASDVKSRLTPAPAASEAPAAFSTAPTSSPPAPASTGGGWGTSFLQTNAAAQQAAVKAVEDEIEKSKAPSIASAPAGTFTFGVTPALAASASPAATISAVPAAEAPKPAASGWGSAFLSANKEQGASATAAAEAAIQEASGAAPKPDMGSSKPPSFLFGGAAPSAAAAPPEAKDQAAAPATFCFGAAPGSSVTFGAVTAAAAPDKPSPTFTFGGAAEATAPAAAPAASSPPPSFLFGGSAPPAAEAASVPAPSFGASSSPSLFGATTASQPFGAAAAAAADSTTAPASSPFGSSAPAASFGFGASAAPAPAGAPVPAPSIGFGASTGGFGGPGSSASAAPTFGSTTTSAPPSTSAFGAAATSTPVPSFGSTAAATFGTGPAAPSPFGSTAPAPTPSFGAAAATPAFGGADNGPSTFTFGGGAAGNASQPSGFTFGAAPTQAPAPAPAASPFGQPQQQPPAAFGAQPTGGFGFGAAAPAQPSPFGASQPSPTFGAAPVAPAAAPGAFSFGAGAAPAAAQPAFGAAPASMDGGGGFTMGGGDQAPQGANRRTVKVRRNRRGGR